MVRLPFILAVLAAAACAEPSRPPARDTWAGDSTPLRLLPNGWDNGFAQDLVTLALASDPIGSNPSVAATLRESADARSFFHYVVGCALPQGATVVVPPGGSDLTFDGLAGLAPEWASGPCEEACQEWVSACLLSRINAYGIPVLVSPRGDHPALAGFASEIEANPVEEGAFYGNFFAAQPKAYACRGRGYDPLYMTARACSQPGNLCGIQNVGPCGDIDGDTGSPSYRHACEGFSEALGGAWLRCHTRPTVADGAGGHAFPEPNHLYTRVITIYTPRSSFGNDCNRRDPPLPEPLPPDGGIPEGPAAGRLCDTDDDCASDLVSCNVQGPEYPFCTVDCVESGNAADEAAQCGGQGTTCLSAGDGPGAVSRCTRTCDATAPMGSPERCPPSQVCTGFWFSHGQGPDAAGCAPYCRDDGDCIRGAHCNPRRAACGLLAENPALAADGEPCDVTNPGEQCRGLCIPDGPRPGGICASLVNFARTRNCPDTPATIKAGGFPALDGIGLCTHRACSSDMECTPPLRCLPLPGRPDACRH